MEIRSNSNNSPPTSPVPNSNNEASSGKEGNIFSGNISFTSFKRQLSDSDAPYNKNNYFSTAYFSPETAHFTDDEDTPVSTEDTADQPAALESEDLLVALTTLHQNGERSFPAAEDIVWIDRLNNEADAIQSELNTKIPESQLEEILRGLQILVIRASTSQEKEKILLSFKPYFTQLLLKQKESLSIELFNNRINNISTNILLKSNRSTNSNSNWDEKLNSKKEFLEKFWIEFPAYKSDIKNSIQLEGNPEKLSLLLTIHDFLSSDIPHDDASIRHVCQILLDLELLSFPHARFLRSILTELDKTDLEKVKKEKFDKQATDIIEKESKQVFLSKELSEAECKVIKEKWSGFFENFKVFIKSALYKGIFIECEKEIISNFVKNLSECIEQYRQEEELKGKDKSYLEAARAIYAQLEKTNPTSQEEELQYSKIGHSFIGDFSDFRRIRCLFHYNKQSLLDEFKYRFIDLVEKGFTTSSEAREQLYAWIKNPFSGFQFAIRAEK